MELFQALASQTRLRLLGLLAERDRNINELADALGVSQPTTTRHAQILEQLGLIETVHLPGAQGTQKRCSLRYDRFIISLESRERDQGQVETLAMPIGLYTRAEACPTCGLASAERIIGLLDDPQSFYHPDRASAQILWLCEGFVEYTFPYTLSASAEIERLEVQAELCSEAPHYDNDWPAEIALAVNGVVLGGWISPGDFGGKRGRLNPEWWDENWTQYGLLKMWSVDTSGSYLDGTRISDVTLADLSLSPSQPITIRLGAAPGAQRSSGLNLFGRGFGNYDQDLVLRLHCRRRGE